MIVADTNLILALATRTTDSELAVSIQATDSEWIAPGIWESEFRNAALGLIRSGRMDMATAVAAHTFARETVESIEVSTGAVLRLAESYGLTAYDAEFAALAEWLGCKLLSFDRDLLKPGLAMHPKDF